MGKNGRLANNFFMLASCYGIAKKSGRELFMPEWKYQDYLKYEVPIGERLNSKNDIGEPGFHFCGDFFESIAGGEAEVVSIAGYLQTEKYFAHCSKEIKKLFDFKDEVIVKVSDPHDIWDKPVIAIHIRRGDFVGNENYYNLPINYFILALEEHFPDWDRDYNILVFSDDINWCKPYLCGHNIHFSEGLSDIEDMCLMTMCDHFILSNSSYSWWGAWLGEKQWSKVVRPAHLFTGYLKETNNPKDFWCERWIEFDHEGKKIDLKDCLFAIPVHYDHIDRRNNLQRVLYYLNENFDTNIVVGEQGAGLLGNLPFKNDYIWMFDMPEFHRTKMLNDMCKEYDLPIFINYDADVIIPVIQLLMGAKVIRRGVTMVYPYDGKFARIPKELQDKDISELYYMVFKGSRPIDPISMGGCVMFDREKFIEGGMENENFISYGPEDTERVIRFGKLDYTIYRTQGTLYHYDHYIGSNSNAQNPHFGHNCQEEDKIKNMSKEQLRDYVDSWTWKTNNETN
jgi:hypothetical protein